MKQFVTAAFFALSFALVSTAQADDPRVYETRSFGNIYMDILGEALSSHLEAHIQVKSIRPTQDLQQAMESLSPLSSTGDFMIALNIDGEDNLCHLTVFSIENGGGMYIGRCDKSGLAKYFSDSKGGINRASEH